MFTHTSRVAGGASTNKNLGNAFHGRNASARSVASLQTSLFELHARTNAVRAGPHSVGKQRELANFTNRSRNVLNVKFVLRLIQVYIG